MERVQEEDQKV